MVGILGVSGVPRILCSSWRQDDEGLIAQVLQPAGQRLTGVARAPRAPIADRTTADGKTPVSQQYGTPDPHRNVSQIREHGFSTIDQARRWALVQQRHRKQARTRRVITDALVALGCKCLTN